MSSAPAPEHLEYFPRVLDLALRKTRAQGPYQISKMDGRGLTTARIVKAVKDQNTINIFWTMTTDSLEKQLAVVDVPLLLGTNGYRIFLIREEDQHVFDRIQNLSDLAQLQAGQVYDWPDTRVMKNNGMNVVTSSAYRTLIPMLLRGRFDYFPRGVYEVYSEAKLYEGLTIETNLALSYDAPIYFFLNKQNQSMAKRIKEGLELAQADGSFYTLFNETPGFAKALKTMRSENRKVFYLDNTGR